MVGLAQRWCWWSLFVIQFVFAQEDDDDNEEAPVPKASKSKKNVVAQTQAPVEEEIVSDSLLFNPEDSGYLFFLLLLIGVCVFLLRQAYLKIQRNNKTNITTTNTGKSPEFTKFQFQFLSVYALCVAADWMQGPYVYKLYSFYGFSKSEIGSLFVSGFASSLVFGTVVAGLADRFGRKRLCMAFCLIYATACATKHSRSFSTLLYGRILSGVATSILHSGFESYFVAAAAQHAEFVRGDGCLMETLSKMSFIRGLVAIVAALVSNVLVGQFGFVSPFDFASLLLVVAFTIIALTWKENYGDKHANVGESFSRAMSVLSLNPRVWLLGFVQACFEGAMYIFVFSWTPILEHAGGETLPHGLVFCCFMVSIMIGSSIVVLLQHQHTDETLIQMAIMGSVGSFLFIFLMFDSEVPSLVLLACCVFEMMVGLYFPVIANQRSKHIANEVRATMLGLFRIPLNIIVVLVLLNAQELGIPKLVATSAALVCLALVGEKTFAWLLVHETSDDEEDKVVLRKV